MLSRSSYCFSFRLNASAITMDMASEDLMDATGAEIITVRDNTVRFPSHLWSVLIPSHLCSVLNSATNVGCLFCNLAASYAVGENLKIYRHRRGRITTPMCVRGATCDGETLCSGTTKIKKPLPATPYPASSSVALTTAHNDKSASMTQVRH